jgi:putative nucleotidyltransferase with HDIG domain
MVPVPQRTAPSNGGAANGAANSGAAVAALATVIPRRPRVSWWLGVVFAVVFAVLVTPTSTADHWLAAMGVGNVRTGERASVTVRVPSIAGFDRGARRLASGGIVIARGQRATAEDEHNAAAVTASSPRGALPYVAVFLLVVVLGTICTHHMRRSTRGRLVRVQVVSLVSIAVFAVVVKALLLTTSMNVLVVPVALFAIVPTLALDRVVGLATGILAALIVAMLGPFDVGVSILLLVQVAVPGLVVAEQPKDRTRAVLAAGALATLCTAALYALLTYLSTGALRSAPDALHSAWLAAALGPAIATVLALPLLPLYQMLVGEITRSKLIELEDLSHPLLAQIAEKAPGTWQHSLMMANLAEIAASAIGASGRLVRVGAYFHDLGKALQPKYFIENLDPGETSPHDKLSPEVSCDAIFAHVTEGIVTARKAGLHERIIDFMHTHHGNGVLEYFWGKCQEQGNPRGVSVESFRYPGHPPQSRETAILAICDAVEAASRTLKKPEPAAIDSLVQRIVYGKLHLGQLDESGLSMSDLRRVADSLRETIRHANHGRIEYPWQQAQQAPIVSTSTSPRLDSLDRRQDPRETSLKADSARAAPAAEETSDVAFAVTADLKAPALVVDDEEWDPETPLATPAAPMPVEPEISIPRRAASSMTTEVDPEQIEAAIEIVPPARRHLASAKKPPE